LCSFPRGIVGGPNESAMNPDQSYSSNVVEVEFSEVRGSKRPGVDTG
jgi:hypothetical protein